MSGPVQDIPAYAFERENETFDPHLYSRNYAECAYATLAIPPRWLLWGQQLRLLGEGTGSGSESGSPPAPPPQELFLYPDHPGAEDGAAVLVTTHPIRGLVGGQPYHPWPGPPPPRVSGYSDVAYQTVGLALCDDGYLRPVLHSGPNVKTSVGAFGVGSSGYLFGYVYYEVPVVCTVFFSNEPKGFPT
ncbi:MAG TPA: hypothetical protein PKK06_05315 [Phycisphaerae bacterium]|nr:hypothetical protein [Phycisphaerae bacterium]HNU44824.1 hypothetical protein [Phycisphaerae bacterium]